jgi:hypothetical protein
MSYPYPHTLPPGAVLAHPAAVPPPGYHAVTYHVPVEHAAYVQAADLVGAPPAAVPVGWHGHSHGWGHPGWGHPGWGHPGYGWWW